MMHGFAGLLAFYLWHQQAQTTVAGKRLLQQACSSFERCSALVPDEPVPTLFWAKVGCACSCVTTLDTAHLTRHAMAWCGCARPCRHWAGMRTGGKSYSLTSSACVQRLC